MDEHAVLAWKATLQDRIQRNARWSAGLRQIWTWARAQRYTDAFCVYQWLLFHPACAMSSPLYTSTLLAACEATLEACQDLLDSLPPSLRALAQERAEIAAEITRLQRLVRETEEK